MRGLKITSAVCAAGVLFTIAAVASGQQAPSAQAGAPAKASDAAPKLEHFDPSVVDKSLDPCQDFYKYACSKWLTANPIPPDQVAWGTGSGLRYWNENILREAMVKAAEPASHSTGFEKQIGDYWSACMDEPGLEAAGVRDLKPELRRIDAMKSKADLAAEVAFIHKTVPGAWEADDNETNASMFGFSQAQDFDDASKVVAFVDQGGMALPGRDFYLNSDQKSKDLLTKYQAHIAKMFELVGENSQQAASDAKTVLSIETAMAQSAMDNVARRDPKNLNNKMSLDQIQALTPSFDFKRYVALVGAPPSQPHYLVSAPDFFRGLEKIIEQHPVGDWKVYLSWQLIHGSAPYLNKAMVDENWNFFSHELLGAREQTPRWRRCVRAADRDLGQALGRAYVEVAFPPSSKERTVAMVHDIENALDRDITDLDWMQPATKDQAKIKLRAIQDKIGYPDHWRDYSSVKIVRDSYLNNVREATVFEFHRQLDKIGKPVDRSEWTMTPPTINAYYDPQLNTINFPAGILQPPFFDSSMEDVVNYGAIGMVIGHETTHGFDDEGRKFDAKGNLRDWWTPADAKAYDQRSECIANEYTEEIPEAGVKQNGHLTLGEDTADNGGLRLAYMAAQQKLQQAGKSLDEKELDGWTPRQKFFLSYAFSWCDQYRPELMRTVVMTNPHSIPKYRVNNVVGNMPEFQEAFSCKKGDPMVHATQCRVW